MPATFRVPASVEPSRANHLPRAAGNSANPLHPAGTFQWVCSLFQPRCLCCSRILPQDRELFCSDDCHNVAHLSRTHFV
jgi:hypothetical protein